MTFHLHAQSPNPITVSAAAQRGRLASESNDKAAQR
jgi:hypothetical protein